MSPSSSNAERLLRPRHGAGVCPHCLNLTGSGDPELCRACRSNELHLAAVLPLSYSLGGGWLHRLIASYKRDADPYVPTATATLAALCERFVRAHESCLAAAASVAGFDLVTTVPSGDRMRDLHHPLRRIVGELVPSTRGRYVRLLMRSGGPVLPRVFDPARYEATQALDGEAVLLIDDMWTSGASAESAAAAMLASGAGTVGAMVIARHLNRGWGSNEARLAALYRADTGERERCALCQAPNRDAVTPAGAQRGASR